MVYDDGTEAGDRREDDRRVGRSEDEPSNTVGTNWWEQPPPPWLKLPPGTTWPPPLKPGESYGSAVGSVNVSSAAHPGTPATYDDPGTTVIPGATPTPPPPPPPGPTSGPAPGPGAGTLGDLTAPFTGQFHAPTAAALPDLPTFTAPTYTPPPAFTYDDYKGADPFSYANFEKPTAESVLNDPGYQFSRDEGERALLQSKAAGGLLNTGGTLKDLIQWGGNFANTRYNDVYGRDLQTYGTNRTNAFQNYSTNALADLTKYQTNRGNAVDTYNTNYQTQFVDPYKHAYQSALDTFAPKMVGYTTTAAATQRQNELDYQRAYDLFGFDYKKFQDQRDSTFDKRFKVASS